MKTKWIQTKTRMPNHTNWVLIVRDNKERGLKPSVGFGWRKMAHETAWSGWWETNLGLLREEHITHWMECPALPRSARAPRQKLFVRFEPMGEPFPMQTVPLLDWKAVRKCADNP